MHITVFFQKKIGLLIVGVKSSSGMNIVFTGFNLVIILFIMLVGISQANFKNWNLKVNVRFELFL